MTQRVTREKFFTFMKDGTDFQLMGEGLQELVIQYNASSEDVHYIHEGGGRKIVGGYSPAFDADQIAYKGDPVFEFVDGIRRGLKLGSEAETEILLVYPYDSVGDDYEADKFKASIEITEFGGAGGESLSISYSVSLDGDPVAGTVTVADGVGTFVATV